jgi:hypothetical protein
MGTRALIHVKQDNIDSDTLVTIYKQMDGYPSHLGNQIATILGERKLVNGYTSGEENVQTNGMGCAAALLISGLKGKSCGDIYIFKPNDRNTGEEFTYTLYSKNEEIFLRVVDCDGDCNYDGPISVARF